MIRSKLADGSDQNIPPYDVRDLHCQSNALSVAEDLVQVLRAKDVSQRRLKDENSLINGDLFRAMMRIMVLMMMTLVLMMMMMMTMMLMTMVTCASSLVE